jgi:hypothetical protein
VPAPLIDLSFPHSWQVEVLASRPLILPPRHFVYPRDAEEVERGALEILVRPHAVAENQPPGARDGSGESKGSLDGRSFLATCALGFRDAVAPTGIWSCPSPEEMCAVSGGYAYLIDTSAPQRFTMLPYRPVLEVRPLPAQGLLLFVGHRSILAWGARAKAWESEKLSDEGITIQGIENGLLRGLGWEMIADRETPFLLDLQDGRRAG